MRTIFFIFMVLIIFSSCSHEKTEADLWYELENKATQYKNAGYEVLENPIFDAYDASGGINTIGWWRYPYVGYFENDSVFCVDDLTQITKYKIPSSVSLVGSKIKFDTKHNTINYVDDYSGNFGETKFSSDFGDKKYLLGKYGIEFYKSGKDEDGEDWCYTYLYLFSQPNKVRFFSTGTHYGIGMSVMEEDKYNIRFDTKALGLDLQIPSYGIVEGVIDLKTGEIQGNTFYFRQLKETYSLKPNNSSSTSSIGNINTSIRRAVDVAPNVSSVAYESVVASNRAIKKKEKEHTLPNIFSQCDHIKELASRKAAEIEAKRQKEIQKIAEDNRRMDNLNKLRTEYDEFENLTCYYNTLFVHRNLTDGVSLYLKRKGDSGQLMCKMSNYQTGEMLCFNQVTMVCDGYSFDFPVKNKEWDQEWVILNWYFYEWMNIAVTKDMYDFFCRIKTDSDVKIRFQNGSHKMDRSLSSTEKEAIREVLNSVPTYWYENEE